MWGRNGPGHCNNEVSFPTHLRNPSFIRPVPPEYVWLRKAFTLFHKTAHYASLVVSPAEKLNTCTTQITRFMGPTWGPPGDDRTQVGPMLASWTLLSGQSCVPLSGCKFDMFVCFCFWLRYVYQISIMHRYHLGTDFVPRTTYYNRRFQWIKCQFSRPRKMLWHGIRLI